MKTELPSAEEFCKNPDAGSGDWFHIDFMVTTLKNYGELCAKHGAKSIREQAIDLLGNTGFSLLDEGYKPEHVEYINELINKIQNLEP